MIVAIDGPAGSGKSTVAKAVAKRLGFDYADTGAMYRALTWKALEEKMGITDERMLAKLAKTTDIDISYAGDEKPHVAVDSLDVTQEIRSPKVSAAVSAVSKVPAVRSELVKKQRALGKRVTNLVVEGRDIGTVVFPDAELKVYLTASVFERARRRHKELVEKGYEVSLESVERDLITRDKLDSTRRTSPLAKAADARFVDTTEKTIDQVVEEISALVEKARG